MWLGVLNDNPYGTNCWLLSADDSDEAVIVDPGFDAREALRLVEAAGRRPVAVLATHGHGDHIADAAAAGLPVYIHQDDVAAFTDPVGWGSGFPVEPAVPADLRKLADGDVLEFAGFSIEVQHTPGHTPGSVCFVTDGFVVSGDLVFRGSIGRSDFPHSDPQAMVESLRRFLKLPDELDVYPGHMEPTTVGNERRTNPFLVGLA